MSRIGKRPINIASEVDLNIDGNSVSLKSNKGEISFKLPEGLKANFSDGILKIDRDKDTKDLRAKHGLFARLISNTANDLKDGFKKVLEFKGTGYRVRIENKAIILNMGYSHEVSLEIPEGLTVSTVKNTITIEGIKRDEVGQFAAMIREVRGPEPYKGKGIKYLEENIKRKAGKAAQSGGKA